LIGRKLFKSQAKLFCQEDENTRNYEF